MTVAATTPPPAPRLGPPPPRPAFASLAVTPAGHFRLHFFGAVFSVIRHLREIADGETQFNAALDRYPFLVRYLQEITRHLPAGLTWEAGGRWWADALATWERGGTGHLPLRALREHAGLAPRSISAFVLSGLVEEDSRFGTLFADLQAPLPGRRPCLELVGRMAMADDADPWSACQPLVRAGLVQPVDRDVPRSEWILRIPPVLWDAARGAAEVDGADWSRYAAPADAPALDDLIVPPALREHVARLPPVLRGGEADSVVVRGTPGSDRLMLLGAVARSMCLGVVSVIGERLRDAAPLLGPLCTMRGAMPVFEFDPGPGETVDVPALPGYRGPVGLVIGHEGGLRGPALERAITLELPVPDEGERMRCWQQALAGHSVASFTDIAEKFHLPCGHVRRAAAAAIARCRLEDRAEITLDDVRLACRSLNRQMLDTLAEPMNAHGDWSQLVVRPGTEDKLRELQKRCRHRERVLDHLGRGFRTASNRGVRVLFSGPSGTGKTLAARILGAELEIDLYRVDLAAVINKYIGETEKNLHRVLTAAEELDVILLLDEGDALLGGRTEVKSSNDRYANLETNYLLQRLEHYAGIVLVTTNLSENIDRAFERRMDVVVEFLPPQAEERLAIWRLHLPDTHEIDETLLHDVAVRCALTGGQIRNAAMHATLLALDDGGPVRPVHLGTALRDEFRKAGAACPLGDSTAPPAQFGGVVSFLNSLAEGRERARTDSIG